MRRTQLVLIAVLIAGGAALLARPARSAPQPGPTNDHILAAGVVNMSRIIHSMSEPKKVEADIRVKRSQLAAEEQKKGQEIQDLMKHRTDFKPGSAQWQEATDLIDRKRAEFQVWQQVSNRQLNRQANQSIKGMYDHVAQAAATIAQQQHLNLVIADESPEILGQEIDIPMEQFQQLMGMRAVLYTDKKADITDDVLTLVEANFAKSNQVVGQAGGPGGH